LEEEGEEVGEGSDRKRRVGRARRVGWETERKKDGETPECKRKENREKKRV
jgi:hypothetical protein